MVLAQVRLLEETVRESALERSERLPGLVGTAFGGQGAASPFCPCHSRIIESFGFPPIHGVPGRFRVERCDRNRSASNTASIEAIPVPSAEIVHAKLWVRGSVQKATT